MSKKSKLMTTQRNLIKELDEIVELFGLNYRKISEIEKEARIPYIRLAKDQYIRSQVVMTYVVIDEFLGCAICNYFFGKKKGFMKLWRTKKFRNFNFYILEKLSLLNKLELAKIILMMPREIENAVRRVNDLRNGLAHSFFPENLRRNKPVYRNESIYSIKGLRLFEEDREKINSFFAKKLFNAAI
jgi:hypothetical protein